MGTPHSPAGGRPSYTSPWRQPPAAAKRKRSGGTAPDPQARDLPPPAPLLFTVYTIIMPGLLGRGGAKGLEGAPELHPLFNAEHFCTPVGFDTCLAETGTHYLIFIV